MPNQTSVWAVGEVATQRGQAMAVPPAEGGGAVPDAALAKAAEGNQGRNGITRKRSDMRRENHLTRNIQLCNTKTRSSREKSGHTQGWTALLSLSGATRALTLNR